MKKILFVVGLFLTTSLFAQTPDFNLPVLPPTPKSLPKAPSAPDPRLDPKINTLFMAHCAGLSPETMTDQASIIIAVAFCKGYVSALITTHYTDIGVYDRMLKDKNIESPVEFTRAFCIAPSDLFDDVWKNVMLWVNENKNVAFSVPAFVAITLALGEKYPCYQPQPQSK